MEMASKTGQAQLEGGIHPPEIVAGGPNSGEFSLNSQFSLNSHYSFTFSSLWIGSKIGQFQLVGQTPGINPAEGVAGETIGLNTGQSRLEGQVTVMNPPVAGATMGLNTGQSRLEGQVPVMNPLEGVAGVTMGSSNTGQSRLEGQVTVMNPPEGVAGVTMGSNAGQAQPGGVTAEMNPAEAVVAGNEGQGFRFWARRCWGRAVSSAVAAAIAALWDCLCGRGGEEPGDDCCFCV
ncbi:hypothetical protein F0562_030863 [Nyssa sinensis]|uniref:Uncharacterized protein n=1 Tax=Nyssa sinensis TaxID=561372 RepID=A0A5J5B200_9ASTE|nr:hypothetical protein F0562_030863 [Nyssa sinensis]